jgi:hypothetical protein
MIMSKENHSTKMSLLAIILTGALSIATPEFAAAHESSIKGFYFKAEGRGNIFAGDDHPYAVDASNGDIFETDLDATGSFRVGAGLRVGSAWDMGILYSGLNTKASDSRVNNPATPTYVNPLMGNGFYTAPSMYGGNFNHANAHSDFSYNVVDFEAGYTFNLGAVDLRVFGGVRYTDTNHTQTSTLFLYSAGAVFSHTREVDQWGIGPRLGIEGLVPLGSSGVFVNAAMSGSALFGDRDTIDTDVANYSLLPNTISFEDNNDFYNAEGEVGIGYGVELGNARSMMITIGYRAEAWYNATDTSSSAPLPAGINAQGEEEEDVFFHGPFLRGTLNF